jgi:hypothetical protein
MFVRETAINSVRYTVTLLVLLLSPTVTDLPATAINHRQVSKVSADLPVLLCKTVTKVCFYFGN